jgi:hypothetical protein
MQSLSQNRSSANTELQRTGTQVRTGAQLPIWPDAVRGGPNAILRSALFAGIQSKKRLILGTQTRPDRSPEGVAIASQDGIKITFAGTQFNQYDADVFFETLHRARRHPLETACEFHGAEFLKTIGRSDSKLNYEDLQQSLDRLRRGSISLEWEAKGRRYIFAGSLIAYYLRETTTKMYKVTFAKEILTLFSPASWTQLEWDERQAIKGKPLAQWLHSYFSTHAAPFPVSVPFLHEKSGSPTTLLKHFKAELKNAFTTLEETLGWTVTWNRNLVSVCRTPSAAQTRHLGRKAARARSLKAAREAQQRQQMHLPSYTPAAPQHPGEMASTRQILSNLMKVR